MMEPVKKRRNPPVTGDRAMDIGILVERVLQKTQIAEMDGRTLVLKAVNSAWKQELFLQKNAIIERCNLLLGKPVVRDVRFV